jgi:hypothetical protein
MDAVPSALAALVSGLDGRQTEPATVNELGRFGGFWSVMDGLDNSKKAAGQHQEDNDNGHGELLSLFDFLSVLF